MKATLNKRSGWKRAALAGAAFMFAAAAGQAMAQGYPNKVILAIDGLPGGALEALKRAHEPAPLPEKMAAFGINSGTPSGLKKLFTSHPPLEERIDALRRANGLA